MRKFTLIALLMLAGLGVNAKDITRQQAQRIAQSFLQKSGGVERALSRGQNISLKLAYEGNATDGEKCLYVFNASGNNGFVIVAADDKADEILGYCDQGNFDSNQIPENMKNWLGSYIDQIHYIKQHDVVSKKSVDKSYAKEVKPLLGNIQWNQDSPYNDMCPVYDISSRCATGCVATAMAQIMYYNRWPEKGVGSYTYSPSIMGGKKLTADFGNTAYDWDNMLPQYDKNSSEESQEAVAQLMLHCGVSVNMEYSSSSGAASLPVPIAFATYFNYDKGIAYRTRQNYSTEEWQKIIIDELDHGRAILAMGRSSAGGHAFVFDGYDRNGLVHVNWGWGGMSNGYFRTTALLPSSQGIGGAEGGFNYNQYIVTGIQKPQVESYADIELVSNEGLVPNKTEAADDEKITLTLHGTFYNAGWQDAAGYFGLTFEGKDGNIVKATSTAMPDSVLYGYTYNGLAFTDVDMSDLPDGEYKVYPSIKGTEANAPWQHIRDEYVGYPNYINLKVNDGKLMFTSPDYFCLNADKVDLPQEIYSGKLARVETHIKNEGDVNYLGEVQVAILNKQTGRIITKGTTSKIDLQPGGDISLSLIDKFNLTPGEYYLTIIDDDERHICNSKEIKVLAEPAETAEIEIAAPLSYDGVLTKDNMNFTAHISGKKGVYSGYAYFFILNESGAVQKGCLEPQYFMVKEGETVPVKFSGLFENGVDGTTYVATILLYDGANYAYLNPVEMATCTFVLGDKTTGIDKPIVGGIVPISIYDINGRRISHTDIKSLPEGIYIIKANGKSYKFKK